MARRFGELLDAALQILSADVPEAYERIEHRLNGAAVLFEVDGVEARLVFEAGSHRFEPCPDFRVRVATDTATILDLVDDGLSLPDALRTGRLEIYGKPGDVSGFDDALTAFLAGAIRTTKATPLLEELRDGA